MKHPPHTSSPCDPGKRRGAAIGLVAGLTFGGKLLFQFHVASAAKLHRDNARLSTALAGRCLMWVPFWVSANSYPQHLIISLARATPVDRGFTQAIGGILLGGFE
jgi:hypothetical protein